MKFTKMQGLGNDYVYVNCLEEQLENPSEMAKFVSDRHFGIGSDGLILIRPSDAADFEMEMYNADGSRGEMCGNGIRCVAKYVYDYGLTDKTSISVETLGGIKYLELTVEDGMVSLVRVDMGRPKLEAAEVPILCEAVTEECVVDEDSVLGGGYAEDIVKIGDCRKVINEPIVVDGMEYRITGVSMGNPHAVVFLEDVEGLEIEKIGPKFENHERFPKRINTEFVRVIDRETIEMRVWERGSGETLACGTGACAAAVASILNGLAERKVTVKLRGGDLLVEWEEETGKVYMTGPAVTVFEGELYV
ncbi:MAG: diaminopimelate epimerase [Dorea sp.]|nr:diaminopimelate epimerase [Dorea sp.]MCI9454267.1 diaminopimelate epimerase [Dorea sp.]